MAMSARAKTANRRSLLRTCGTCGKSIMTTADTPWLRQVARDGKRQASTYFCSEQCFAASYKHKSWFDGRTEARRKEKEARRDIHAKNRRYYITHQEKEQQRSRDRYWSDPEAARADNAYHRRKRRLLADSKEKETV